MKHCSAMINMSSVRWSFCFILRALENPKEADCPHPDSRNNGVVVRYLEWGVHWKRIVGGCTIAHLKKRIVHSLEGTTVERGRALEHCTRSSIDPLLSAAH